MVFQDKEIRVCVSVCCVLLLLVKQTGPSAASAWISVNIQPRLNRPHTLVSGSTTLPLMALCESTWRRDTNTDHIQIFL